MVVQICWLQRLLLAAWHTPDAAACTAAAAATQ